jgi:HK97 family phage major capsid protein
VKLKDLQERRALLITEMRAITEKPAGDGGDLSAEQASRFDALKAELQGVDARVERQRVLDEAERRMSGETLHGDKRLDMELRGYSLTRALAGAAGLEVDWGRERELSAELAKRAGRPFQGIAVPMSLFTHAPMEQRVFTTTNPAGGPGSNIIPQDYRPDQFIDILRPNSVVYRMGARMLTGLMGDVKIPRLKVSAGLSWVAENAAISATDPQAEQVSLAPKHAGSIVEFSRNLLLQTSPDVEQLLRMDMARIVATGIDKVSVNGGGSNEPVGILATAGIGDVPLGANGAAPTWASVLQLIETAQLADGPTASAGFLTSHKAVRKMRSTVKVATTDSVMIQEAPNALAGYPLAASNNVPSNLTKGSSGAVCSALIFGDLSEVLIGVWSELDILVNPFESTAYSKGNVQVRAMASVDVKLRHPASFAAIKDMLTT